MFRFGTIGGSMQNRGMENLPLKECKRFKVCKHVERQLNLWMERDGKSKEISAT